MYSLVSLVTVEASAECALYLGGRYITSASPDSGDDVKSLHKTAEGLAHAYGVDVNYIAFGLEWAGVEIVLRDSGDLPVATEAPLGPISCPRGISFLEDLKNADMVIIDDEVFLKFDRMSPDDDINDDPIVLQTWQECDIVEAFSVSYTEACAGVYDHSSNTWATGEGDKWDKLTIKLIRFDH